MRARLRLFHHALFMLYRTTGSAMKLTFSHCHIRSGQWITRTSCTDLGHQQLCKGGIAPTQGRNTVIIRQKFAAAALWQYQMLLVLFQYKRRRRKPTEGPLVIPSTVL
jgi:hypothetical protein